MRKNKKRNRIFLLIILLLGITIGFAALATTLKINGNATITKNVWSVYWEPTSVAVTSGSKGSTTPTVENGTDGSTNTKVTWSVNFELPGDFYEFTVDAANAGTLDAMITQITPTVPQDLPSYISYSVKYADGRTPALNHLLPKGTKSGNTITPTTETYKIRIEFKTTITPEQMNAIPDEGLSYDFGYEVKYGQADENAEEVRFPCPGPNCVYAYYTESKNYAGDNRSVLTNYTSDYTTLVDGNSAQREVFLGHILDSDDKITRGFACGIKDSKIYCVEGTTDGSTYSKNRTVHNLVFSWITDPSTGRQINTCSFSITSAAPGVAESRDATGETCYYSRTGTQYDSRYCVIWDYGYVSIKNVNTCVVSENGTMSCD